MYLEDHIALLSTEKARTHILALMGVLAAVSPLDLLEAIDFAIEVYEGMSEDPPDRYPFEMHLDDLRAWVVEMRRTNLESN